MVYILLDKSTEEVIGTVVINPAKTYIIEEYQAKYYMIEGDESFRGKKPWEIIVETGDQPRLATQEEIIEATKEMAFNVDIFLGRLAEEFSTLERLQLSQLAPNFITELQYHNFAEIKVMRDYLEGTGGISSTQIALLNSLFAEQNINLDDYETTGI